MYSNLARIECTVLPRIILKRSSQCYKAQAKVDLWAKRGTGMQEFCCAVSSVPTPGRADRLYVYNFLVNAGLCQWYERLRCGLLRAGLAVAPLEFVWGCR